MARTLFRYIFGELFKLMVLSAGGLVIVMAVGFAIKPMSEGSISAASMAKLLLYLMPGMLTYALPIAAAFSATMVFFRMAQDNEITACAMSGISYRSMLLPAAVLGIALTLGMFFLSNFVIPGFWSRVEQLAQQDIVKVVVSQLKSGRVFRPDRSLVVYADDAEAYDPEPDADAPPGAPELYKRVWLKNAAVGKSVSTTGMVEADYTGESAVLDLYRYQGRTYVVAKLTNATVRDPDSGMLVRIGEQAFTRELELPFEQRPKFMSLPDLRRIVDHPDRNLSVRRQSAKLRQAMATQRVMRHVQRDLSNDATGRVLTLVGPQDERYALRAGDALVDGTRLSLRSTPQQPVQVRVTRGAELEQIMTAQTGELRLNKRAYDDKPRLTVELNNVTVADPRMPTTTNLGEARLTLLQLDEEITRALRDLGAIDLISASTRIDDEDVGKSAQRLRYMVESLRRDVAAAVHQRAAMAVCTLTIMLLGGVMSMLLRHSVPLMIFFWCFVPTIVAIIAISSGENVLTSHDVNPIVGIVATWSGVVGLGVLISGVYVKLAKH